MRTKAPKVYAKAIADIAPTNKELSRWMNLLSSVGSLMSHYEINKYISAPTTRLSQKVLFMEEMLQSSHGINISMHEINLIEILLSNGRIYEVGYIHNEINNILMARKSIKVYKVTSAYKLTESELEIIKLSIATDQKIQPIIDYIVDEKLIGGIRVESGGSTMRITIKDRLEQLSNKLEIRRHA